MRHILAALGLLVATIGGVAAQAPGGLGITITYPYPGCVGGVTAACTAASGSFGTLVTTGLITAPNELITNQLQINSNSGIKFWATTGIQSALAILGNVSNGTPYVAGGTINNFGGPIGLAVHAQVDTIMDASANVGGVVIAQFNGTYDNGAKGGLAGVGSTVGVTATPADAAGKEFVAGRDNVNSSASVVAGNLHALIGRTIQAQLGTSSTGWGELTGMEIAMLKPSGSSVVQAHNLYTMRYAGDAVRATGDDIMLGMWNQYAQGAATGVKAAIDIGPGAKAGLYFPVGRDGTVIKATQGSSDAALTVANGIDFSAIGTITGNSLAFPNFTVTGAGSVALAGIVKYTGAVKTTPATGATVTFAATQRLAIIVPAGTIAALTVTLPACAAGNDGDERAFLLSQIVTVLTVGASAGSVVGGATSAAVGSGHTYHCYGADTAWYQMN